MENQNNHIGDEDKEKIKVKKVSIKEINKSKEDEIVDNIMKRILQIK